MTSTLGLALVTLWLLARGIRLCFDLGGAAGRWRGSRSQRRRGGRPTPAQARLVGAALVTAGLANLAFAAWLYEVG